MPAATSQRVCRHCGNEFAPTQHRAEFCCAGCQFVHDLITKNGLGQFYDLQAGGVPPVKSLVFQKRDLSWLEELVAAAEAENREGARLLLELQGITCIGCVWLLERITEQHPGVLAAQIDPTLGRLGLRWQTGACDVLALARQLQAFGYLVGPPGQERPAVQRGLIIRLGICGALAMNTMLFTLPGYLGMEGDFLFAPLFHRALLVLGTLSFLVGGSYFFVRTWQSLRLRVLQIDLPIALGLIAAYAGSVYAWSRGALSFVYFDFVSIFVFLMLVGRWLQQKVVEANRHRLLAAGQDLPPVTLVASGGKLPVADLAPGVVYRIAAGQAIPVRSRLRSPAATLGLAWINGESDAALVPAGRTVPSGAISCGQEAIELVALEGWSESLLAGLLRLTPSAARRNPRVERFIRGYLLVVVSLALLGALGWWWFSGDVLRALQVLISVLVVSCPCASGIALPLIDDLAASGLRKVGVFVRESSLWGRLDAVRKIIFDKTGTLTLETMALRDPEALAALTGEQQAVLLSMVLENLHPVSGCLREVLLADGVQPAPGGPADEAIGFGLEKMVHGKLWRLGRPGWAGQGHGDCLDPGDCLFSADAVTVARFSFREEVRADAPEEIAELRRRGARIFILSGDRERKVAAMGERLGLPAGQCLGELSPQEKADWVCEIDAHDTLLIGDGANDSLAFNHAWCTGTPAVDRGLLEHKADFYFLGRGLAGIRLLLDAGIWRRGTIRRVLAFTIAYNVFAIGLSLGGLMNPLAAAVLMPLSSLVSLGIVLASRPGSMR